jgi:3-methyladenine DNA glycosylase/8-oxoguanine DNA glycosylase/O6-methylguanine-DNA--protein-cysteine methyltransferase
MAFTLLETVLGPAGLEWSDAGLTRLLFRKSADKLRAEFAGRGVIELRKPPRFVREATRRLQGHLQGDAQDFADVPLDFASLGAPFRDVAAALRSTRAGETLDADAFAASVALEGGSARLKRLLARNPLPILVPGHRILGADGLLGVWGGGEVMHERLLLLESMGQPPLHGRDGAPAAARVEEALTHLRARDAKLGALIDRVGPYQLELRQGHSPYEALARSIVGQQISGRAAQAILGHLASEFGTTGVPPPDAIRGARDAKLRAAGLSAGKARAFRDLAAHTLAGRVPSWAVLRRWPDERILSTLTEIHGIGQWTVEMVLMFRLGRPDVLPLGDLGIRKGYGRTFSRGRMPSLRELQRRGWRWRPFRSVASWYLWRALELP